MHSVFVPTFVPGCPQDSAHGETCKGPETKQRASQNGVHACRDLSCTVLGCSSCPSVLTPSNESLNAHRFFDLSKGFTVRSLWWLDFISFLSAQSADCLLHPLLVHQAGILEELCVVLASYWSTLAPGEIEVWKKKCVCGVGLIFLDTKNVWKNEVSQRNAYKSHTSPEFPERQRLERTEQYVRKYQKWKKYKGSF